MTKFERSFTAFWWLRILKEELAGLFCPSIGLEQVNARLKGQATLWVEYIPEVIRILSVDNIAAITVENKNTFIQLPI